VLAGARLREVPMPWRYTIDAERGLVISTGWGRMTFAEMQAHQDQLASDPHFNPEFRQLVDATAITELNISIAEASKLAGRRLFSPKSKRAFLGSGLSIVAAKRLMQAYAFIAKGREQICVFHERNAALTWLGLGRSLPQNTGQTTQEEPGQ
jgi:hypothetical protein